MGLCDALYDRDGTLPLGSAALCSMLFPDGNPIGQLIRLANAAAPNAPQPWFTIVGVAPTVPQIAFNQSPEPVVYLSLRRGPLVYLATLRQQTEAELSGTKRVPQAEMRRWGEFAREILPRSV